MWCVFRVYDYQCNHGIHDMPNNLKKDKTNQYTMDNGWYLTMNQAERSNSYTKNKPHALIRCASHKGILYYIDISI